MSPMVWWRKPQPWTVNSDLEFEKVTLTVIKKSILKISSLVKKGQYATDSKVAGGSVQVKWL